MLTILEALFCLFLLLGLTEADERDHRYKDGDDVKVWIKSLSPLHNVQETYRYDAFFCTGADTKTIADSTDSAIPSETLADALLGIEFVGLGTRIKYRQHVPETKLCRNRIKPEDLTDLIKREFVIQGVIDGIDFMANVGRGEMDDDLVVSIYTTFEFVFGCNKDQIIWINVRTVNPVNVSSSDDSIVVDFKYSVEWVDSSLDFSYRLRQRYKALDMRSVAVSVVSILAMIGIVIWILWRSLGRDYARYEREELSILADDYGWKLLYGDVFRPPPHLALLSALLGGGSQLLTMAGCALVYTLLNKFVLSLTELVTSLIYGYCLGGLVAGYVSGKFYMEKGGKKWVKTFAMTLGLFPLFLILYSLLVNSFAIAYGSTKALAAIWIVKIIALWCFAVAPLTLIGTLMGRNLKLFRYGDPCRINSIPRPIPTPSNAILASPLLFILANGALPFFAISFELYFIFGSLWSAAVGSVCYEILFSMLSISLVLGALSGILSTYHLLSHEDHQWQWKSFLASGALSSYLCLYAIYYYVWESRMTGIFQSVQYFMNMAMGLLALYLMLGSFGFFCCSIFVRIIYSTVKMD